MPKNKAQKNNLKAVEPQEKELPALASVDMVEDAVKRIAEIDRDRARRVADYEQERTNLDQRYLVTLDPLLEERKVLEAQVLRYAKDHRAEISGKRWQLRFGAVVFSKASKAVQYLIDAAEILAKLRRSKRFKNAVRTTYSIDKDALKSIDPKFHEKLGFEVAETPETATLQIDVKEFELNELRKAQ